MPDGSVPVAIEVVAQASEEALAALANLLPQLSATASPLTRQRLEAVVTGLCTQLLVGRIGGSIVGALTLVMYTIPTGLRARIEDVVVDQTARGQGAGKALIIAALGIAKQRGARTVDLTSTPSKIVANHLYRDLGFTPRESTTYRMSL
ncbi:GNAT family N-acetyltransferase [Nocardia transvalensis]|uniref:GNAT family N-acetyltransferase n=1 Tax=Nocardia transvalensis TaxID=37333 RepID=UPI001894348D|nr:GNAT family N-acetyltransferase [Nocardia transvalensis]MBF6333194.1 GNAT family N-acetyltransferase [Nocardia transvalensis]